MLRMTDSFLGWSRNGTFSVLVYNEYELARHFLNIVDFILHHDRNHDFQWFAFDRYFSLSFFYHFQSSERSPAEILLLTSITTAIIIRTTTLILKIPPAQSQVPSIWRSLTEKSSPFDQPNPPGRTGTINSKLRHKKMAHFRHLLFVCKQRQFGAKLFRFLINHAVNFSLPTDRTTVYLFGSTSWHSSLTVDILFRVEKQVLQQWWSPLWDCGIINRRSRTVFRLSWLAS